MRTSTQFLATAFGLCAAIGLGQASEKIGFEQFRDRLGGPGTMLAYRAFTVVTLDGKKHKGRRLRLEPDHVRIFHMDNSWEDLPGIELSRVEIRQARRFSHHISDSAEIPLLAAAMGCGGMSWEPTPMSPWCMATIVVITSPVWAYTAASAPFILAADTVTLFIPPKVYEIVH